MAKEFFKNLPDTSTPLNASRINGMLNGNEAMGNIVVGDVKCKNLFNKGTIVNGWLNYANNVLMETHQSNYVTSDYISVKSNTTYTLNLYNSDNLGSGGIMFYDGAKSWISPGIPETQTVITFTTTPDTEYVRFVLRNDAKDNVQIEEGTSATEYTPYKEFGIESGSNSNGSWVKFDDGNLIQCGRHYIPGSVSGGELHFPIPFKDIDYRVGLTPVWGNYRAVSMIRAESYIDYLDVYCIVYDGTNWIDTPQYNQYYDWIAIGRWK